MCHIFITSQIINTITDILININTYYIQIFSKVLNIIVINTVLLKKEQIVIKHQFLISNYYQRFDNIVKLIHLFYRS